ncbi:MAG: IS30 family transposase, partial [Methylotenera sp.]
PLGHKDCRQQSRHQMALVSLVERKSGLTLIQRVRRKTAEEVSDAMIQLMQPLKDHVMTITSDNGREFAGHEAVANALSADFYFAHPYASWERGTNENTHGLIRQYFPKDRDFRTITDEEINTAMRRLNHRPRKSHGFKTPHQLFLELTVVALHI